MKLNQPLSFLLLSLAISMLTGCATFESSTADSDRSAAESGQNKIDALERPAFIENENKPDGLTAELVYDLLLSSIAFQRGEIEVASNALIRAAQSSEDPVVISRAVRMAIHSKQYEQAFNLGQRWITLQEQNHLAHIITAMAAVMNKHSDKAIEILQKLLEEDKQRLALRFGQIGEVFIQNAEGEQALSVLQQVAAQYPKLIEGWMVVAGMAQKNKNFTVMRAALDEVLALEPDNQKAAGYQLQALAEDKNAQTKFAKQFIQQNPKAFDFRLQYARGLLRDEQEDAALDTLLDLLKKDAGNNEAINLVALLYQSKENHEQAAKYLKLRLKTMPDDDRTRVYLANALQQLKRYDEAKAQLNMVKDGDELFSGQRQMAMLIEQADGIEPALEYLSSLQGKDQAQKVQLIVDRELMLKRAGRNDEALALINEGLTQYENNETLIYHRALVTVAQEDLAAHEADMRFLLERNPDNAHYYNTLGYSLLVLSDRLDEAGELITKANQLEPEDPYILDSMGWLAFKRGNIDQALVFLEKAFALDEDAEIAAHLGEVYWVKGEQDKARDIWQHGDKIDADNKALQETKDRFIK